ncbi:serine hydrolase [Pseudoxanthomonas broegbernensis]|uniref:Serine hydrolase n=1 Tax=Pseudoxanthomonas broegbernensis TaxID=83619 RepID=A0A7V8GLC1_9GAMM|nr:serine hydrolase domain-containing protein [Pseudoxanthomonas broegbernensis]KAF1685713.1 serine hydrolase [Pseudoxanthomonas broegbernensis]MBB6066060.1 CubicO group peptidase (beta-lactamase class C family) [Pseudoxanthomonas broegbernensis]
MIHPRLTALLSVLILAAASLPATALPPDGSGAADVARIEPQRIDEALGGLVDAGSLVGVSALVWQDGREAYFGSFGLADREAGRPIARDTIVQIFSMTKPVTGVALMQLYEQGKFQLDDPLAKYLPEFADVRVHAGTDVKGQPLLVAPPRPILVRDLLRHTAGFVGGNGDSGPVGLLYRQADPENFGNTLEEMSRRLATVPLLYAPGTRWLYSPAVDVQARLVEVLSGQPFDRYLQRRVFDPLKMKDTRYTIRAGDWPRVAALYLRSDDGVMTRIPDAEAYKLNARETALKPGSWGLTSTLDDYMRFARMLGNGGELDGARLLKPATVRLMASDALPAAATDTSWLPGKGQVGFGIDFAVRIAPPKNAAEASGEVGEFFWDGAANTLFWVDPTNDIAAVLFAQWLPFGKVPLHKAFRDAVYYHDTSAAAPRE